MTLTAPAPVAGRSSVAYALRDRADSGPEPADQSLLRAFLAGDRRAFDALLERHQQRVYAVCFRYFGNRQDAEDATQEVFITLARHAATIEGTSKLSTWLYRVALNTCHDLARRRARRPVSTGFEVPEIAERSDRMSQRETELDVQGALSRLDHDSRSLLVLVAIEDRTYAEAAEIMGMSVAAVKSRIHRARLQLGELLTTAA